MQKTTDRSNTTPIKSKFQSKYQYVSKQQNYQENSVSRQVLSSDLNILKQQQNLKNHFRTLETQNRNLMDEIQRLKIEKEHNETKFLKEIGFKQNTFRQYQEQKNFQIDQMHNKFEEEIHRIRREKDKEYQNLVREFKRGDLELREKTQHIILLENKNRQLEQEIVHLEKEVLKSRESHAELNDKYQQLSGIQRNLEVNYKQLQVHRNEMEQQIRILLQIEAQKSQAIQLLQIKLSKSENSEKNLMDKLQHLSINFEQVEIRMKQYSEKLGIKQREQVQLKSLIDKMNHQLTLKQKQVGSLSDLTNNLKKQLDEAFRVEKIRQNEILQLISENEKLYNELNISRHRIHDLAVTYNFIV